MRRSEIFIIISVCVTCLTDCRASTCLQVKILSDNFKLQHVKGNNKDNKLDIFSSVCLKLVIR